MKTRTKITIPVIIAFAIGLFYLFMVANGYSPYYEGIGLTLYSDYQLQEMQKDPHYQKYYTSPIPITDEDLRDAPELKQLIKNALSKEYPLNKGGRVPITFGELDSFHQQYA